MLSLLRTRSRGRVVKADGNRTAVRVTTELRDEESALTFRFGRHDERPLDGSQAGPRRRRHAWAPTLKALRRVALVTVMETTELRDRDNGAFTRLKLEVVVFFASHYGKSKGEPGGTFGVLGGGSFRNEAVRIDAGDSVPDRFRNRHAPGVYSRWAMYRRISHWSPPESSRLLAVR